MSLWKVDDGATRDLMIAYYEGLGNGGGRTEALRQAQLAMLASKDRAHPYYWASFIPSGDWRSLEGKDVPMHAFDARAAGVGRVKPGACGCESAGARGEHGLAIACAGLATLATAWRRRRRRWTRSDRGEIIDAWGGSDRARSHWWPARRC
jgi:hypothetical protein